MIVYILTVYKNGNNIFSHDIIIEKSASFSQQVKDVLDRFRVAFPEISLSDDDVKFAIAPKG